jgi:hypothetical protein
MARAGAIAMNSAQLLPLLRDLYSRHPEMYDLEAWELQSALFVLGYTDDLVPESEIAAAVEGARTDWPQWRPAA